FLLLLAVAGPHPDSMAQPLVAPLSPFAQMQAGPVPAITSPTTPAVSALAPSDTPLLATGPTTGSGLRHSTRAHVSAPSRKPPTSALDMPTPDETRHVADGETALLADALTRLHHEHDAVGALSILEGYPQRFPHGQLAGEVALVEAEALLKL